MSDEGEPGPSPAPALRSPPTPRQLPSVQPAPPPLRLGRHSASIPGRLGQAESEGSECEALTDTEWERPWSSAPPSPGGHQQLQHSLSAPSAAGDAVELLLSRLRLSMTRRDCREALAACEGDAEAALRFLRCRAAARWGGPGPLVVMLPKRMSQRDYISATAIEQRGL